MKETQLTKEAKAHERAALDSIMTTNAPGMRSFDLLDGMEAMKAAREENKTKYADEIKSLKEQVEEIRKQMDKVQTLAAAGGRHNEAERMEEFSIAQRLKRELKLPATLFTGTASVMLSHTKLNKLARKDEAKATALVEIYNKEFVPQFNKQMEKLRTERNGGVPMTDEKEAKQLLQRLRKEAKQQEAVAEYNHLSKQHNQLVFQLNALGA